MSAARRLKKHPPREVGWDSPPRSYRSQRRERRRRQACVAEHWRGYLESAEVTDWLRPWDQDVRIAHIHARCRRGGLHRFQCACPAVITRKEEVQSTSIEQLRALALRRLEFAWHTLIELVVPYRRRRWAHRHVPLPFTERMVIA